jgi:GLPGLI family protein
MKTSKLTLLLAFGILSTIGFSQTAEGVITYETRINMHRMLPPGQEERKAMIPEFRTVKNQLFFNSDESIYKPLIEEEEEETGGGRRQFRGMQSEIYLNHTTGIMLTKQDFRFASKQFLVVDTVKVAPWKFGTETKSVAGFDCKQAYYTDEETKQTVTAWFTDKLRPFVGPDQYNTLPGAILALDINNGERVIVAKKVEMRPLKKGELQELTGGERISRTEFRKYMEEMRKRRQANGFRN